ncbi:MAG: hypothetical protein ACLPWF_11295 [Bryobacteraceae bacterium]
MGSIASTNPASTSGGSANNGLQDLLQTLTNENSPLLSTLSSPNIQSALQNAPPGDIVEISEQAQQLQSVDALFGISNTANSSSESLFSALANIGASGSGSSLTPGSSLSDQLAAYQGNQQTQETQALFGITPATTTPNSLFDVFA